MQDFLSRRYIVVILEIVEDHLAREAPTYDPGELQKDSALIERILSELHNRSGCEVQ